MINVITVAQKLGYIKMLANTMIDIDDIGKYSPQQLCIITTGSQGEPMSALSRMANAEHKKVEIMPGDRVIISASPIPGNEKFVSRLIDELFKQGADVIYHSITDTHVSGHACQEELKLIHALVQPKFFIPVHGEYKHLRQHAKIAEKMGMDPANIFILSNGRTLELDANTARVGAMVNAGRILVDGLGVGDVGSIVLRDRKHLASDGVLTIVVTIDREAYSVLAGPDIVSRGFVHVRESDELMDGAKNVVKQTLEQCLGSKTIEWSVIKSNIRNDLGEFLYSKTKRKPIILPIIMEV
jgi:ribonuclease J